jgi:hypothetical protein
MNIYKNIIIADIIFMTLSIIFLVIINANIFFHLYHYYLYHYITIYLYIFLKGIFGIIVVLKQIVKNNKPIHGRKYLFCLLPTAIIFLSCLFYWVFVISYSINYGDADQTILDVLLELLLPYLYILNNKVLYLIFVEIISSMLFQLILFIGLFMWLIFWTFYYNKIKKWIIILINIVTPLYFVLDIITKISYGP